MPKYVIKTIDNRTEQVSGLTRFYHVNPDTALVDLDEEAQQELPDHRVELYEEGQDKPIETLQTKRW